MKLKILAALAAAATAMASSDRQYSRQANTT